MTKWNTELPTQIVIGWTTPDKVTDEQVDELLCDLDAFARSYADEFWRKYDKVLYGLPIDHPDKLKDMQTL